MRVAWRDVAYLYNLKGIECIISTSPSRTVLGYTIEDLESKTRLEGRVEVEERRNKVQEEEEEAVGGGGGGGIELGRDGARDTEGGEDFREQAYRKSSRQSVSPPVSSVAESEPSSPRPVPFLRFDGPRLARAKHIAVHPTSPCSPTPAHGVIGPCIIPRLMI